MATLHSCCSDTRIELSVHAITVGSHEYTITIVCCSNCGSLKSQTNVKHVKSNEK